VVNAYRELAADGLVEGFVGKGTIVASPHTNGLQDKGVRPMAWAPQFVPQRQWAYSDLVQEVADLAAQPGCISLAGGVPTPELYPVEAFRQACHDFLLDSGGDLLANCPAEGLYPLRQWLADWLAEVGIQTTPEHVLITSGSTQGLDLIARALIEPNDEVVIENPTSMAARYCFHAAGARLIGVPIDSNGMRLDSLRETMRRHRPKFIYTLPTFQNPTGLTLNPERRAELLDLAQESGVPVVEDDPYNPLSYSEPAPAPIKALDVHGYVIYLGTFSKLLFPGLRLGWIVGASPAIERLALIKRNADLFTNTLAQGSAWHFLRKAGWQDYLETLREEYSQRCDIMVDALHRHCPPGLSWRTPAGGFYLWVGLPDGVLAQELLAEARLTGVSFLPGGPFCVDGSGGDSIRLNFSYADAADIVEGVKRLGRALVSLQEKRQESPRPPATTRVIV
jgi:DNA-binding transcriptional MocR family regulator